MRLATANAFRLAGCDLSAADTVLTMYGDLLQPILQHLLERGCARRRGRDMRLASADPACARIVRPDGDCRLDQLVLGESAVITMKPFSLTPAPAMPSPKVEEKRGAG